MTEHGISRSSSSLSERWTVSIPNPLSRAHCVWQLSSGDWLAGTTYKSLKGQYAPISEETTDVDPSLVKEWLLMVRPLSRLAHAHPFGACI